LFNLFSHLFKLVLTNCLDKLKLCVTKIRNRFHFNFHFTLYFGYLILFLFFLSFYLTYKIIRSLQLIFNRYKLIFPFTSSIWLIGRTREIQNLAKIRLNWGYCIIRHCLHWLVLLMPFLRIISFISQIVSEIINGCIFIM